MIPLNLVTLDHATASRGIYVVRAVGDSEPHITWNYKELGHGQRRSLGST